MLWVYDDGGRSDYYRGHAGDCTVRAIAIASDTPYRKIYNELAIRIRQSKNGKIILHFMNKAKSPRNGVPKAITKNYLQAKGWTWHPTMGIGTGCKVHLKTEELPSGRLIVQLSRHLVAVIDGVIHDTYNCSRNGTRCVYGYWSQHE